MREVQEFIISQSLLCILKFSHKNGAFVTIDEPTFMYNDCSKNINCSNTLEFTLVQPLALDKKTLWLCHVDPAV